jgi:hypothetical protein
MFHEFSARRGPQVEGWRASCTADGLPRGTPRHLKANQHQARRRGTRAGIPDQARIPVRVIEYEVPNRDGKVETIKIMTTILDPQIAPAGELAALYAQRWEFELTLDEIETHQMSTRMLRSRTPELVRQEIWGAAPDPLRGPSLHARSSRRRRNRRRPTIVRQIHTRHPPPG